MNETDIMAFIKWLPTKIKELQNKSPEEIASVLNELSKTEEGQLQLKTLVEEFKQSSSETPLFKEGGKLNYLVEKFQKGNKYNREQARENKKAAGLYNTDEETGQKYRKPIDKGNLKAKVAKSKAVEGYDNKDFISTFNRKDFRQKKHLLKETNPNMSRRERKAEALLVHTETPNIDPNKVTKSKFELSYKRPKKGSVFVGDLTEEIIPNPIPPTRNINVDPPIIPMPTGPTRNKLNWNEFANAIETRLRNDGSFKAGMDYGALQALMENEYERYNSNPDSYKFDNYQLQNSRFNKYRGRKLTMPQPAYRNGYGDFDQNTDYLFNDEILRTVPTSKSYDAMTKGISYPITATILGTAVLPSVISGMGDAVGVLKEVGKKVIQRGRESEIYPHLRRQFGEGYNPATAHGGGKYGNAPYYLPDGTLSRYMFFKKGGIIKFEKGGQQRKSDEFRKDFHGVDLFKYGPNSRQGINNTLIEKSIPSGSYSGVLPNGVGIRQISRKNITTTELVSPDKKDTLYIHNGIGGRADSNIDDSGVLGLFGIKKSSPVSDRYKELQKIFKSHKF